MRSESRRWADIEKLEPRLALAVRALPTVSIDDASVVEGHSGTKTLSFVLSLSAAASQTTTVQYGTADGTATTSGGDFVAKTGTVSFRPGQRTASIAISVRGDRVAEPDETFTVRLVSATGATLARSTATGTIVDDDAAARTVSVTGPANAVNEGGSATFTFTLSQAATVPVTVSYATANLTASSAADYTATTGSFTFAVGQTSRQIAVTTRTDSVVEPDESFQMRIVSVSGAAAATPSSATATIKDVPPPAPPPVTTGSWTILVYMTGEDLNTYARDDINEMERALGSLPSSVRIVVAWDQPKSGVGTAYATGGGTQPAWRTYGRSVLRADSSTTTIASTFDLSLGERNTGDPKTLVDFVTWGVQQAPAQKYFLQMWGHGAGLDGSQFDSESADDALTIGELATALAAPGMPTFDLVSYDNCLMGMAEVGAALAPRVPGVFVASEELINGTGQDYVTALNALKVPDPAGVTALQVAAGMVSSYQTQYAGDAGQCDTFSAVRTSGYAALTAALKDFVDATAALTSTHRTTLRTAATSSVSYDTASFRDLKSFMTKVVAASSLPQTLRTAASSVSEAITSMVSAKTSDQRSSGGIAVYLPTSSTDVYLNSYATDAAAFCQATGWNTFAKWLATGTRSGTVAVATSARSASTRADVRGGSVPAAGWAAWSVASADDDADSSAARARRRQPS